MQFCQRVVHSLTQLQQPLAPTDDLGVGPLRQIHLIFD